MSDWAKDPSKKPKTKQSEGGKPVKSHEDLKSVAWAICQKSVKQQAEVKAVMLEGVGPVILGVALTNRPHLPLPPVSIVERNGQPALRVPFLKSGIFRHPNGDLVFDDEIFFRMLENHARKVNHHGVSVDVRHKPELGALAWFDADMGGEIVQEEDDKFGKLLVGYGKPSEAAKQIVEQGQYRFASIEYAPNYESNVVKPMSGDDLRELTLEEFLQEGNMGKNTDGTILLSAEEAVAYEKAQATITELEGKVKTLEAEVAKTKTVQEPEIPETVRVRLERAEQEARDMRQRMLNAEVDAILERARNYVDGQKRKHAPVLLEWADALLRGKPLGKDGVIKLEQADSVGGVVQYVHAAIRFLLENAPGCVLVEGSTEADQARQLERDGTKHAKEDYQAFWGGKGE